MSQDLIKAAKASVLAYNDKDWDAVRAAVKPNVKYDEVATHNAIEGVDNVLANWKAWAKALPDSKAKFHSEYASGDTVVFEVTWTGTHTGPMQSPQGEIPATNRTIDIRACQVVKVEGGKIASFTHYFDMATMMQQLGLAG